MKPEIIYPKHIKPTKKELKEGELHWDRLVNLIAYHILGIISGLIILELIRRFVI